MNQPSQPAPILSNQQKRNQLARLGLQWSLGLVLAVESSLFAFSPAAAAGFVHFGLPQWVRIALALCELLAAILFLIPPTLFLGGYLLLVTFFFAAAIHLLHGKPDIGFLIVYSMAVLTILTGRDRAPSPFEKPVKGAIIEH